MTTKHTAGPWFVQNVGWVASQLGLKTICSLKAVGVEGQHHANARLIAAAPDLLEALQAVLHDCPDLDMVESNEPGRDAGPWLMATNAIAKAIGVNHG